MKFKHLSFVNKRRIINDGNFGEMLLWLILLKKYLESWAVELVEQTNIFLFNLSFFELLRSIGVVILFRNSVKVDLSNSYLFMNQDIQFFDCLEYLMEDFPVGLYLFRRPIWGWFQEQLTPRLVWVEVLGCEEKVEMKVVWANQRELFEDLRMLTI